MIDGISASRSASKQLSATLVPGVTIEIFHIWIFVVAVKHCKQGEATESPEEFIVRTRNPSKWNSRRRVGVNGAVRATQAAARLSPGIRHRHPQVEDRIGPGGAAGAGAQQTHTSAPGIAAWISAAIVRSRGSSTSP
jgi:hypothetical protein